MPFLALKKNPFPADGGHWHGAGSRAEKAATKAVVAANQVLKAEIIERSADYDRWDSDLVSQVGLVRDERGMPRVGLRSADDGLQQRAVEAEYGDEENPPAPLMRVAQSRARGEAARTFSEVLRKGLFG